MKYVAITHKKPVDLCSGATSEENYLTWCHNEVKRIGKSARVKTEIVDDIIMCCVERLESEVCFE